MTDTLVGRLRQQARNRTERFGIDACAATIEWEAAAEIERLTRDLADWKQAASVEAGLRREFLARATVAESSLSKALKAEREACAKVAEASMKSRNLADRSPNNIASAIRSREAVLEQK